MAFTVAKAGSEGLSRTDGLAASMRSRSARRYMDEQAIWT